MGAATRILTALAGSLRRPLLGLPHLGLKQRLRGLSARVFMVRLTRSFRLGWSILPRL
jgi:hypothetical protein